MSNSVWPHRWQPTRLLHPWDSPGKNTGVGCHFLLQCMKVKSESEVAQLCPTHSDPMDCSLPGSSVHGSFQARVLEWGAIAFSASCGRWGYSSLSWASHGDGFSRGAWFPGHTGSAAVAHGPWRAQDSVVMMHGFSCSTACGIFPDQRLNWCPLHWQADSYPLYHQGSPIQMYFLILLLFSC